MRGEIGIATLVAMFLLGGIAAADQMIEGQMTGAQVVKMDPLHSTDSDTFLLGYKVINGNEENLQYHVSTKSNKNMTANLTIFVSEMASPIQTELPNYKESEMQSVVVAGTTQKLVFGLKPVGIISNYEIIFDMPGFIYTDSFIVSRYDVNLNGKIEKNEADAATSDYFDGIITRQESIDVVISNYDLNGNGKIEKNEAVNAVLDYFNGMLEKQETVDIIRCCTEIV